MLEQPLPIYDMPKAAMQTAAAPMETKVVKKHVRTHPPFSKMVMEALTTLGDPTSGHGVMAMKKAIAAKYPQLHAGWEKNLSRAVKVMVEKHQLVHTPGHAGTFRMSKAMMEKQQHKKTHHKTAKVVEEAQAVQAVQEVPDKKKKMAKAKSPAKRAKKADMKAKA